MVKMYSLLIAGRLYRMSFQRLNAGLTEGSYRGHVKRQLLLLVAGFVAVLVLAGQLARAAAGPGPNDQQDALPAWASDGVHIAFQRTGGALADRVVVSTSGGKATRIVSGGRLRGWVAGSGNLLVQVSGTQTLVTQRSATPRALAFLNAVDATPSADGSHLAYLRDGTLYTSTLDGSGERAIAADVAPPSWDIAGPVWSPDGTRIAVSSGSSLLLVQADGSGTRTLFSGRNQSVNPSWSRDGATIAFERNASDHWEIWLVNADGTGAHELYGSPGAANWRYPQFSPVGNALAFISDFQHVPGGATQYQFALYVRDSSGNMHKLVDDVHPYSPPRWSPTAALIAVSAGQECRRWGVYITRPDVESRPHRRSNLCRFDGTATANTIHGSPYFDLINGNGGNDLIHGNAGNDKISGEDGNDTIYGDVGNDFILAGPGDDRVFGGAGNDTIIGGNGRDHIDCGPGDDTVEGAGPLDAIARNCEHIRR
jgi:Ca2+-binding RTX toxin-like protein